MHIEADLLRTRRPSFITEAVQVLAIMSRIERMVARGNGFLVDQVLVGWADDLNSRKRGVSEFGLESMQEIATHVPVAV